MRRIIIAVTVMALLVLAAGCAARDTGGGDPAVLPAKIVVQAPAAPPTAPLFKLVEEGLPGDIELELIIYKSVEEATARVVKGEADFTVLPVNVAAKLYNLDVDISLANVSTWGILYLVSVDPKVQEWEDLKGDELYVGAKGSTPDVLTQYLLHQNGLGVREVGLTYANSPEIAQMLINGLATSAVLPEPMVTQVLLKNQQARVVRDFYADWQQFEGAAAKLPQAGMIVDNRFARSYPGVVDTFHQAYAEALDFTVATPAAVAPLVEAGTQMPAPVFVKSMERTRLQFATGTAARDDVEIYLARLLEISPDMVGGKLPDEKFFLAD